MRRDAGQSRLDVVARAAAQDGRAATRRCAMAAETISVDCICICISLDTVHLVSKNTCIVPANCSLAPQARKQPLQRQSISSFRRRKGRSTSYATIASLPYRRSSASGGLTFGVSDLRHLRHLHPIPRIPPIKLQPSTSHTPCSAISL
jgi:hypothetical protein